MRVLYFISVFALSGAIILTLASSASAQTTQTTPTSPTLQIYTRFAGQYDTYRGWLTTYGNPSVKNATAEPTIAAGISQGQTRLMLGANASLGQFFNALKGPGNYHNAQQDLASVFPGILPSGYKPTQPQLLRDQSAFQLPGQKSEMLDRYIIVASANDPVTHDSRILISITKYNVAAETGSCLFFLDANSPDAPHSSFADSPRIGMSGNALLITANMFSYTDSSLQHAKLWMLPKADFYNNPAQGTCPAFRSPAVLVLNQVNPDGTPVSSVVPAKSNDSRPIAYLLSAPYGGGSALNLWKLDTTVPTTIRATYRSVPTHPFSTPPLAQQHGTTAPISTWGSSVFNAVYQTGRGLWTVNTTSCTPANDTIQRSCLQWYQLDPDAFAVVQQGLVQAAGWHFYAPAIAVNSLGDAVLVFNGSAADHYVGVYYAGRYHSDALNTVQYPIQEMKAGEACYVRSNGHNTVSFHSDATVDPIYNGVFWIHSTYTAVDPIVGRDPSCQNNDWTTAVGAVQFTGPAR